MGGDCHGCRCSFYPGGGRCFDLPYLATGFDGNCSHSHRGADGVRSRGGHNQYQIKKEIYMWHMGAVFAIFAVVCIGVGEAYSDARFGFAGFTLWVVALVFVGLALRIRSIRIETKK